jgi:hypothetical protein
MKNARSTRKLMLNAETIVHLRRIATEDLGAARGGMRRGTGTVDPESFAATDCPKTGSGIG